MYYVVKFQKDGNHLVYSDIKTYQEACENVLSIPHRTDQYCEIAILKELGRYSIKSEE